MAITPRSSNAAVVLPASSDPFLALRSPEETVFDVGVIKEKDILDFKKGSRV